MIEKFKTAAGPILPGLGLSFMVAVLSKIVAIFLPKLGAATLAILIGIVLGNTLFKQAVLEKGTKFSESRLLEYSVVLLGFTVTFQTISQMGIKGVIFILLIMTTVITCTYFIGKKLGFNQKMSLMMAGGNAVCGSSAIGAIAPAIKADDEEKGQIITLVNLLGTIMMLSLPFLGLFLFKGDTLAQSALLGGTLQSVGQVVAGASLINETIVQYSMLFKILRIIMLVLIVLVFERIASRQDATIQENKGTKRKISVPWYITGFFIFCVLNSFVKLPPFFNEWAHFFSTWFETTALAAIGLRLDFRKFLKEGPRFLLYGLGVGTVQTIAAVLFIFGLGI